MTTLLERVKAIDLRTVLADLGFQLIQNRRMKCPFHEEETASLHVYPLPQNEFHCFGCGQHGDVINFYAAVNGLDFKTALDRLAYSYLPDFDRSAVQPFAVAPKKVLYQPKAPEATYVYQPAHSAMYEAFMNFCLRASPTASSQQAIAYLKSRGLSDWTLRQFKIFTIPHYQVVNQFLKDIYSIPDLQSSGLMNENGNLVFYRHPIVFPYFENNRVVYLQGRTIGIPPEGTSKYQFLKGVPRPLFNLDFVNRLPANSVVCLTEGVIDCLTMVQRGTAALSVGSASQVLKPQWLKMLRKHRIEVWFDNDAAGQKGSAEWIKALQEGGVDATPRFVPTGFSDLNDYFTRHGNDTY